MFLFWRLEKMKKFLILIISILTFFSSCKKPNPAVTEQEKDILQQILMENESIHKFLMKEEEKIPDTNQLIAHVVELVSLNGGLKSQAEKMQNSLKDKETQDVEKFFQAYSSFSENLAESLKLAGGTGVFNRFYCPMVNKTWVSQGTKIQNPYAPEMRDCGDLVH
ncbi:DUF3347 domain-containing protein [Leptospira interrogans]|uniref:LIC13259/LIC11441 family protein n=1 Tax=Leptospira interrogans TaxID=173 RepID=UPI0010BFF46E|nr:DUF3347 domain-containing protein [Leptospira interrogans]KAA1268877.1 hypothetical protein C5473_13505 [Leptospira interrogans serovar Weerasinghe]KAA1290921.1 hypothetical protein C4X99_11540 [Leptospira interrogans serovar Geyaweera]QCO38741.1 DUF3347 domain-containing protein [Leptospira interrogans]QCO42478.1 DUF3347 domain-containing protein [Leptospira interrogans]ULG81190.1 DUF3347 domain-containing protein [Leptospira interrogans]